jgi:2-deoxy-D-gluconate 3-dehydrogenase
VSSDPTEAFRLDGKVALVTGGNGGIGKAVALAFRAAGAEVLVTGRSAAKNAELAADLGDAAVHELDVRDENAVMALVETIRERHGRLDVLVNNAGIGGAWPLFEMSKDDWHAIVDASLTGSFLCSKHAAKLMIDAGHGGSIINLGSMYSVFGAPRSAAYGAAKTGVLGLTRALAVELGPSGIRVNAILPGWIETAMTKDALGSEIGVEVRRKTPATRFGDTADLVGPMLFLASDASRFVTGAELAVDGGYHVSERPRPIGV